MVYPIASIISEPSGLIPVYDDIVNYDAGINEEESKHFMKKILFHYKDHLENLHMRWQNPEIRNSYESIK